MLGQNLPESNTKQFSGLDNHIIMEWDQQPFVIQGRKGRNYTTEVYSEKGIIQK